MIGIIGALEEEVAGLKNKLTDIRVTEAGSMFFYEGNLMQHRVAVALSGVGKVNAALTATYMIAKFPGLSGIINTGVAGGIGLNVRHGDFVLADITVQHDAYYVSPEMQVDEAGIAFYESDTDYIRCFERVLRNANVKYHIGTVATGDEFINSSERAESIRRRFGAVACDMESAAIAQVCRRLGKKFISARSISDRGDGEADEDFNKWVSMAAERSIENVCGFLASREHNI